jgi:hypothetical protein
MSSNTKQCPKCGGRGTFHGLYLVGPCLPCNGSGVVPTAAARKAQAVEMASNARAHWTAKLEEAQQLLDNPFVTNYRYLGQARLDAETARKQLAGMEIQS